MILELCLAVGLRAEDGNKEFLNTECGADSGEEFSDEVRANVREQEMWDSKVVHPVRQKGVSREESHLFGDGESFGQFGVPVGYNE